MEPRPPSGWLADTSAKQIIVLVLAAVAIAAIVSQIPVRSTYDEYVCTACGVIRTEYKKRIGPIVYRRQVELTPSPISETLKLTNCPHFWLRYRFGHSSGFLATGWKSHLDGGSRSYLLQLLLSDERFARDLAGIEQPSTVLSNLLVSLNGSQELDASLDTWWLESERTPFSEWWKTNQMTIHAILVRTNR